MTICPCCGFKSTRLVSGELSEGCASCGSRPVGEPLPRPEHELPSFGRSLLIAVMGTLMMLTFLAQTIMALTERSTRGAKSSLQFLSMIPLNVLPWLAAAETAAWRLKWVAIPLTIVVLYCSRKLYRSILQSPSRFCGLRYARTGYMTSAAFPVLILILIGVTVPERLHQRRIGIDAGVNAVGYTFDRAIFEYSLKFQRVPNDLSDLRQLPDADGSIAAALKTLDPATYPNAYRPYAELAAKQKPRTLRGAVIRNASFAAGDDTLSEGLSFTGYELRLPGPDKLMGTEDDLMMRDGLINKASESPRRLGSTAASTEAAKP